MVTHSSLTESVSESVSQSVSQSVGESVSQSTSQPVSQSISQSNTLNSLSQWVSQSVSQQVRQQVRQSVSQSVSQSLITHSVSQSISRSNSHLITRTFTKFAAACFLNSCMARLFLVLSRATSFQQTNTLRKKKHQSTFYVCLFHARTKATIVLFQKSFVFHSLYLLIMLCSCVLLANWSCWAPFSHSVKISFIIFSSTERRNRRACFLCVLMPLK